MTFKMSTKIFFATVVQSVFMISVSYAAQGSDPTKLKTTYICHPAGVALKHGADVVGSDNDTSVEVTFDSRIDDNQNLVVGNFAYLIWPRKSWGSLGKSVTIMKPNARGNLVEWKTIEIADDASEAQNIELPVTELGKTKVVTCSISMKSFNSDSE